MLKQFEKNAFAKQGIILEGETQWMPHNEETEIDNGQVRVNTAMENALTVNNFFNYIDPNIIQAQLSAMNADKLLPNRKVADWTMDYATFPVEKIVGSAEPFSNFTNNYSSAVNNYVRQIFRYHTSYKYGVFEIDCSKLTRLQFISKRQNSAASLMGKTENAIYLRGVNGVKLYGLLNDPNVAAPITPNSVTTSQGNNKTSWADKTVDAATGANFIYNDIMKLWQELVKNNSGLITNNTPITLAMSYNTYRYMLTTNNYNVTVEDLVKLVIPNITIVKLSELSLAEGERLYMICPNLNGQQAGFLGFSDKLRVMPIIQHMGYFEGGMCAATFGCVITQPSLIACMSGV